MSKLYCSKSGQGPNLVLLHGWGSSSKIWHKVAGDLALKYQVWCVDLPGHGHSHAMHWDCSTEQGMQLLADVLPPAASFLGWSLGGLWALLYARQYPDRVVDVMLVSSAPRFTATQEWPHGMAQTELLDFSRQFSKAPQQTLKKFCSLQAINSDRAKPTLVALRSALSSSPVHTGNIAWGLKWLEQVDLRSDSRLSHLPVDLLHGEEDQVLPVDTAEGTNRIWPHARVERIPKAGHAPFVSHPEQFLQWVAQRKIHE
ncbi:MAG: alpha/beta fold hydrolase [Gammaproteobacteria bacterium]|nr:alpha/beta fold hydrolase [Gammaproteobacteria bacterium]